MKVLLIGLVVTNLTLTVIVAVIGGQLWRLLSATQQQVVALQTLLDQISRLVPLIAHDTIHDQLYESDLRSLLASLKRPGDNEREK